ncbi:MAG: hypothetical protein K0R92_1530 [Lachnospiraceae bacterium]|jgi:hypothetical protein|nr:hypothetical protein [Lachnospiraceae bacterium]
MENKSVNINQHVIGNNNSTALNVADGNVTSIISGKDLQNINELLDSLRKLLDESGSGLNNELVLDDIDTIQEQLKNEKPKKIRLISAVERIKQFALKIPQNIKNVSLIYNTVKLFGESIQPIIDKLR